MVSQSPYGRQTTPHHGLANSLTAAPSEPPLISLLVPWHLPRPDDGAEWTDFARWLSALNQQAGPAEIVLALATPSHRVPAGLAAAASHRLVLLAQPYRPPAERPVPRAAALNAAAAAASGEVLLVLHRDCRLPSGALAEVRTAVAHGRWAGCFARRYDQRPPWLSFQQAALNACVRATAQGVVGTNAMWLRREWWRPLPEQRLLEDVWLWHDLLGRVGRRRLHCSPLAVQVSARRYRRVGVVRTAVVNALVLALYRGLGVPADLLADELYLHRSLPSLSAGELAARVARVLRLTASQPGCAPAASRRLW